jgi:hypothetical protein
MRAIDCNEPPHEAMHFTGGSDDDLVQQLLRHRDQYHPQVTDDQIRESVAQTAYDE